MNLLLQDIAKLDTVKEVVAKAPRVARYIRDRKLLLARFECQRKEVANRREDRGFNKTLSLPVSTRWYSFFNCLVSVIKNREAIVGVFEDSDFMAQYRPKPKRLAKGSSKPTPRKQKKQTEFEAVVAIILDDEFWSLGKKVMKLLAPNIKKLGMLETDGCSAGMVYWSFVDLLKQPIYCRPPFLAEAASSILDCIKARWEFLHTDTMAVAFLLDPTKDPGDFVDNDREKSLDHVRYVAARLGYSQQQQEDAYREASAFLNSKWDWGHEGRIRQGRKAPLEWWGHERETYPNLYEIARRIFTMPTSSAAAERSWSIHSYIHSKLRNRLTAKNVQKLAFVYSNRMKSKGLPPVLFNQSVFEDCDEEYDSEGDAWGEETLGPFLGCDAEQSSEAEVEDVEEVGDDEDVSVDNCYEHDDEDEFSQE